MFTALDAYVERKLPTAALQDQLAQDQGIEVHGIFPPDAEAVFHRLGYYNLQLLEWSSPVIDGKRWNTIRPSFYTARTRGGSPVLLVAVVPGADYVMHYATLVRHYCLTLSAYAARLISVHRYRDAEEHLNVWSKMPRSLVRPGGRVVIGYVDEILHALGRPSTDSVGDLRGNYGVRHLESEDGTVATFVGVKYSFWGSISFRLARELCLQGASEIIYAGKLGALSSVDDLYHRIFVPSRFMVLDHIQVRLEIVPSPRNPVLARFRELDSGLHVSIPTVLEEDYNQRRLASECGAVTIDNEISQIAWAVAVHNRRHRADVGFSAVHFATDYLRKPYERTLTTAHDLSRNREARAADARDLAVKRIADQVIEPYLRLKDSAR